MVTRTARSWDLETDVIVVGYGLAGAVAAVSAHDEGARVTILEKVDYPGGSSVTAGGSVKVASDAEGVFKYLARTQGGRCSDELVRAMAQGMVEAPDYLQGLGKLLGAKFNIRWDKESDFDNSYPFPGWQSLGSMTVIEIPGFEGFPRVRGTAMNGQRLIKLVVENANSRNIPVIFSTPVKELVQNSGGEILGVTAEREGKTISVKAKKGVILASGGFEFNEKLKIDHFEAKPVYSMGHLGNTGDGILMAQSAGAYLSHMWHFHGSYGFKFKDYPMAFRNCLHGPRHPKRKLVWINVDKCGKRFMNEYHPAPQDTMHRPLEYFDPDIQDYPRIPCYLIFDEEGRKMGPISSPMTTAAEYIYEWSRDNSQEVEKGWIISAKNIRELAKKLGLDQANLARTVRTWNGYCQKGKDEDFQRPPGTMMAIENPPFYALEAWPICTNTQGGPDHNAKQQVLDPYGVPIPRLYAAGELGSFYRHLYLLGGNLAECVVGGRIAGKMAARERAWE